MPTTDIQRTPQPRSRPRTRSSPNQLLSLKVNGQDPRVNSCSSVMQNLWSSRILVTRTYALVPRSLSNQTTTRLLSSSAPPRTKTRQWSAILLFIPGLSAFGLGSWQIMRQKWKVELLEHRRDRLRDDVVPIDLAISSVHVDSKKDNNMDAMRKDVIQSLEYKRVQCQGVFAEDKSIYLGPRGRTNHGVTERGYFLITPLFPVEGDNSNVQVSLLVNRDWVPGSWRDNHPQHTLESRYEDLTLIEQGKAKHGVFSWLFGTHSFQKRRFGSPEMEWRFGAVSGNAQ